MLPAFGMTYVNKICFFPGWKDIFLKQLPEKEKIIMLKQKLAIED